MKKVLFFIALSYAFVSVGAQTNIFPSSGSVGIGTANPQYALHLLSQGNTGTVSAMLHGQYYGVQVSTESAGSGYYALNVLTGTTSTGGGGTSRLYVGGDGNVGIGTTSPSSLLHVRGSAGNEFVFFSSGLADFYRGSTQLRIDPRSGIYNCSVMSGSGGLGLGGTVDANHLTITSTGKIGIGTTAPTFPLSVQGTIEGRGTAWFTQSNLVNSLAIDASSSSFHKIYNNVPNVDLSIGTNNSTTQLYLKSDGNIGIGTADPHGYKLAVNGDAIFTKVKVKVYNIWPDYVFGSTYRLPTLKEVEYIKQHQHLPEVPSAKEVEQNGLDVGDNQALLLRKIEELTLYIIDQDKKIASQQEEIKNLKNNTSRIEDLSKQIEILRNLLSANKKLN